MREIYQYNLEKDNVEELNDDVDGLKDIMNRYNIYTAINPKSGIITSMAQINLGNAEGVRNKSYACYQSAEVGFFSSMPSELTGQTALFFRDVCQYDGQQTTVKLTELYPVSGRLWFKSYNAVSGGWDWGEWTCHDPTDYPIYLGYAFADILYHATDMTNNHMYSYITCEKVSRNRYKFTISGYLDATQNYTEMSCGIYLPRLRAAFGLPSSVKPIADVSGHFTAYQSSSGNMANFNTEVNGYGMAAGKWSDDILYFGRFYNSNGNFGGWQERVLNGCYIKGEFYLQI